MSLDLRARVAIVGVGCTPFGELYDLSPEDLLCAAVDEALADAGCERERIEAAWVGTVMSSFGGDALADALKLFGRPMTRVQNYCASADGAAAAVVCRADLVRSFTGTPAWPLGIGLAAVSGQPYYKPGFGYVGFEATVRAAEQAYAQAKVTPTEVDFAEVHDCFTITEILNYEDLGFCARGEGGRFVEEGRADLGGEKPVNPSGGLKSYGHPVGATGVRMIYELATQLRGQAGARQVKGAKIGLAHNLGGPGAISCVSILTNQA